MAAPDVLYFKFYKNLNNFRGGATYYTYTPGIVVNYPNTGHGAANVYDALTDTILVDNYDGLSADNCFSSPFFYNRQTGKYAYVFSEPGTTILYKTNSGGTISPPSLTLHGYIATPYKTLCMLSATQAVVLYQWTNGGGFPGFSIVSTGLGGGYNEIVWGDNQTPQKMAFFSTGEYYLDIFNYAGPEIIYNNLLSPVIANYIATNSGNNPTGYQTLSSDTNNLFSTMPQGNGLALQIASSGALMYSAGNSIAQMQRGGRVSNLYLDPTSPAGIAARTQAIWASNFGMIGNMPFVSVSSANGNGPFYLYGAFDPAANNGGVGPSTGPAAPPYRMPWWSPCLNFDNPLSKVIPF